MDCGILSDLMVEESYFERSSRHSNVTVLQQPVALVTIRILCAPCGCVYDNLSELPSHLYTS